MTAAGIIPSTNGKFQKVYASTINDSDNIVNPATEEKQDEIIENQTDGTQKTQITDSDGDPLVNDPMLTIAHGSNPKVSKVTHINKFGENPNIDTATAPEDIWDAGGLWVPPTAARVHNIVSTVVNDSGALISSGTATGGSTTTIVDTGADFVTDGVAVGDTVINDTNYDHSTVTVVAATTLTLEQTYHANDPAHAGAGNQGFNAGDTYRVVNADSTGASIIHVLGLDSNMEEIEEFVIMNGTTNVATVNSYYRIFRLHIDGAASRTVTNVGDISATAVTDATVTAQINAGNGQTGMAIYTIPKGKIGYMTHIYASIVKDGGVTTNAAMTLRETPIANVDGAGSRVRHYFGCVQTGSSDYHHPSGPYSKFLENTDIFIRVDSVSANGTVVSAGFDLILVDIT